MKRLFVLFSLALALWAPEAVAQARTVTGRVTAAETGAPVAGVSVLVPGTSIGTLTNTEGRYSLQVPANATTLRFQSLSYATQDVEITGTELNVTLESQAVALEGVVVTALGIERQARTLGVAAEAVSGDELSRAEPNIVSSLSGKVSGVNITSSTSPGGSSRIVIRGENSITGDNQPLWVIDGIPVDNYNLTSGINADQGGFDYGNAVQDLNPDAIESLTVLKGPNAAALYGSRASNGAIIVTTKKGENALGGAQIIASQMVAFEDELRLPDYQNKFGQGLFGRFSYADGLGGGVFDEVDESWGPPLDVGLELPQFHSPIDPATGERVPLPWVSNPDNVDRFFDVGRTYSTNVSVAAATDRLNGRFGVSHLNQDGMVPGFELERTTLSFGGGMDATDRLNIVTSIQYSQADGQNRPGIGYGEDNPMSQFIWFGRQVDMDVLKQNYDEVRPPEDPMAGLPYSWNYSFHPNPYYLQLVNDNEDSRNRLIGQISATYQLTPWLNAMLRTGTDWYQDTRQKNYAQDNFGGLYTTNPLTAAREYVAQTGAFGQWDIGFQETNTDFLLTANPDLDLPISTSFMFGGNRRDWRRSHEYTWVGELATPGIYNVDNAAVPPQPFERLFRKRVNSLYGQVDFGYNDYLFLTVSGRNDWSSTLPEENNSYFYPSVSSSFVFSDAIPALQNVSWLNYGKLRASWAQVGNDTDPYELLNVYVADEVYGDLPTFSIPAELKNAELKPEMTRSWEVGAELAFLDDRLGFDVTYYNEETRDQILPVEISRATGYNSRLLNAGVVENKGWEALMRLAPIQTNDFRWETTFTFADNKSTVVELAEGVDGLEISLGDFWFTSVFAREGEPYGQLVGRAYLRNSDGQIIVDSNGLPMRTGAPIPIGNFNPDWRGSWGNEFSYKGLRLNVLLDTRQGGQIYSVTKAFGRYAGVLEETAGRGRCVTENPVEGYPICDAQSGIVVDGVKIQEITAGGDTVFVANDIPVDGPTYYDRLFVIPESNLVDASYVKLREMTLAYELPTTFTNRMGINGLQLSLIGRNLFLWTPDSNKYIDPETAPDATNVQGFEYGQMPTARSIGLNISVRP